VSLVGYSVSHLDANKNVQVTAYWKVNTPELPPLRIQLLMYDIHGKEEFSSVNFPSLSWCPTSTWKPGTILRTTSSSLGMHKLPNGLAHVAIALLPFSAPFSTISSVSERLPLQIVKAPPSVTPIAGTNALQLDSFRKT
jgi:hypothetical protein